MPKSTTRTIAAGVKKKSVVDGIPALTTGEEFDKLSDEQKERVYQYFDRKIPLSETRPLTDAEWNREKKAKKKMGRPKVGQGAKLIAVTVEKGLLKRADAYAKRHGMKRAEMIAVGLRAAMELPSRKAKSIQKTAAE